jgi:hypothetical protein
VVAVTPAANAQGRGFGPGLVGGLIVGGIVGAAAANAANNPPPPPPGYYYAPGPAYVAGPQCHWAREQFWDGYGWRMRRVQVCN